MSPGWCTHKLVNPDGSGGTQTSFPQPAFEGLPGSPQARARVVKEGVAFVISPLPLATEHAAVGVGADAVTPATVKPGCALRSTKRQSPAWEDGGGVSST